MKHKKKHRHRMIKTRGGWTACGVCGEEKAMKRRGRIKNWGEIFLRALRRGCDHGYAAFVADAAIKREGK